MTDGRSMGPDVGIPRRLFRETVGPAGSLFYSWAGAHPLLQVFAGQTGCTGPVRLEQVLLL